MFSIADLEQPGYEVNEEDENGETQEQSIASVPIRCSFSITKVWTKYKKEKLVGYLRLYLTVFRSRSDQHRRIVSGWNLHHWEHLILQWREGRNRIDRRGGLETSWIVHWAPGSLLLSCWMMQSELSCELLVWPAWPGRSRGIREVPWGAWCRRNSCFVRSGLRWVQGAEGTYFLLKCEDSSDEWSCRSTWDGSRTSKTS